MTGTRERARRHGWVPRAKKRRFRVPSITAATGLTLFLSAFLIRYLLGDPAGGAEAARSGLSLAAKTAIPSLFPFFVLSSLLVRSGAGEILGKPLARPFGALLGVSEAGVTVLLLGAFCGFPVGGRTVAAYREKGVLGEREAARLLPLSNSPSFAFLYSAVGTGLYGDPAFGLRLYLAVLLSTLVTGILLRILFGACVSEATETAQKPTARSPSPSALLSEAVISAAGSALSVTGFIVFFSVLSAAVSALLSAVHAGETASLLLSGLLELTAGAKKAAETVDGLCGRVLCGFFAGFGGLCASLQVIATVERPLPDRALRKEPSLRSYILCKILMGLLSALFVFLFSFF